MSLIPPHLSGFDFHLLTDIVKEWSSFATLQSGLKYWKSFHQECSYSSSSQLRVLLFNVRGLDKRCEEVLLLMEKYDFHCLVLIETGAFDMDHIRKSFINYKGYYQEGENSWGGVLMLVKNIIPVTRIKCDNPNICVIDLKLDQPCRLMGVYAPSSKSWDWDVLSRFIIDNSCLFGDFNVDLEAKDDEKSAEKLIEWSTRNMLTPILPDSFTSLRSLRTIDYVFARGSPTTIQVCNEKTTSDHKPLISTVDCEIKESSMGSNTHWKVFQYFLSLTLEFWDNQSKISTMEEYYVNFITLLDALKTRCTLYFPIKKYRIAIPKELRAKLSYVRALSLRHKRTGDTSLMTKIKELRKLNRIELAQLREKKLANDLSQRYTGESSANIFWSKLKKNFKSNSSLVALLDSNNKVVKDTDAMLEMAATHYEQVFSETEVYRPHPYVDYPAVVWENVDEPIPPITFNELLKVVDKVKKKHSNDAHGISPYMLRFLPIGFLSHIMNIFNESLANGTLPSYWKHVKMKLLAKKESVCLVKDTRPISLLDIFLKLLEKLFLNRFQLILKNRGILHDSQSGFRANFRLQARVLNLIDQISALMSSSAPVATVFVDFKQAFDQLWWAGCLGKLLRLGIPKSYVNWIDCWLRGRTGFIEINNKRSRLFPMHKGAPQGSCLTPAVFITYHSDMWTFLNDTLPNFFADDLACVVGGMIGVKYSQQSLDLEIKLKKVLDYLEYYSTLSIQPINYSKTELLWSARAIIAPTPEVKMGENVIAWVKYYKYLGYYITPKLGWGKLISTYRSKIRQRVATIKSCRLYGTSSIEFRKVLFSSYVLPLFTWLYGVFPLFTSCQRDELGHFYYSCLRRSLGLYGWNDLMSAVLYQESSLEARCARYWFKFMKHLNASTDGQILFEHHALNLWKELWLDKVIRIKSLHRSKRFRHHRTTIEQCLFWLTNQGCDNTPSIPDEALQLLRDFPGSFID